MSTPTTKASTPASVAALVDDDHVIFARLSAIVSAIVGLIVLLHPGYTEPTEIRLWVTVVSLVLAAAIFLVDLVTHRQLKAVLVKAWVDVEGKLPDLISPVSVVTGLATLEHSPKTEIDLVASLHRVADALLHHAASLGATTSTHAGATAAVVPLHTTPAPAAAEPPVAAGEPAAAPATSSPPS